MAQQDLNDISVIGRLTRDSEYREYGENGKELKFSIANNRGYGDFEHVNFIDCKIHGKRALSLNRYLIKGQQVAILGEFSQDRWQDKDGNNRNKMFIECSGGIQLLGGGKSNNSDSPDHVPTEPKPAQPSPYSADYDDEIPF